MGKFIAPGVTGDVGSLARRRALVTALYGGYALFCFAVTVGLSLPQPTRFLGLVTLLVSFGIMWYGFFSLTGMLFNNSLVTSEDTLVAIEARRSTMKREAKPYSLGAAGAGVVVLAAVLFFAPQFATVPIIVAIVLGAFLIFATLPTVMVAWTEPDMATVDKDPYAVINHNLSGEKLLGK